MKTSKKYLRFYIHYRDNGYIRHIPVRSVGSTKWERDSALEEYQYLMTIREYYALSMDELQKLHDRYLNLIKLHFTSDFPDDGVIWASYDIIIQRKNINTGNITKNVQKRHLLPIGIEFFGRGTFTSFYISEISRIADPPNMSKENERLIECCHDIFNWMNLVDTDFKYNIMTSCVKFL